MKTFFLKLSLVTLIFVAASCSGDDKIIVIPQVQTIQVANLGAPQTIGEGGLESGPFVKYNFRENRITTGDDWDIAVRGTTIIVNGGVKGDESEPDRTGSGAVSTVSGTLASVTLFPAASTFVQDGANSYAIPKGSGKGWYVYNESTHIILPIAGKVFVVRTHDGKKYAKFQILSYYKDAPATIVGTSLPGFYLFNFGYQENNTNTF